MNSPNSVAEFPLSSGTTTRPDAAAGSVHRGTDVSSDSRPKTSGSRIELLVDFAALAVAWEAAAWISRFSAAPHGAVVPPIDSILLLYPAGLALLHARKRRDGLAVGSLLSGLADHVIVLSVLSTAGGLLARQAGAPVALAFLISLPLLLLVFTTLARGALHRLRAPTPRESVAVLGAYDEASAVMERMRNRGDRSIRGVIVSGMHNGATGAGSANPARPAGPAAAGADVLGNAEQLGELVNAFALGRIIIVERGLPADVLDGVLAVTARMRVNTSRFLDVERAGGRPQVIDFCGVPLLDLAPGFAHSAQGPTKRVFDFVGAGLLLLTAVPLFAAIAVLTRLSGPGPIFYCGTRVGRGGRHFVLYKFRSMRHDAAHRVETTAVVARDGHLYKLRRDPRITRLGGWLRRSSLDELPQLINVLRGEMSLVGPRPLPAEDLEPDGLSRRFRAWSLERAEVTPGITGLWQVRGRSDLPFDRMIELDLRYAREWSPALDIRILLETPLAVLAGRGAY